MKPLQKYEGFFFLKFLFRADMLAQHRLLKIVKALLKILITPNSEKNVDSCQIVAKF